MSLCIEETQKKPKLWKRIALITLTAGVLAGSGLYKSSWNTAHAASDQSNGLEDHPEFDRLNTKLLSISGGEALCRAMLGSYTLYHGYVLSASANVRTIATRGDWNTNSCEYNPIADIYVLKGEEETDVDIEAVINSAFRRIATAKYRYKSAINISRDGRLLDMSFEGDLYPEQINKVKLDKSFDQSEGFIEGKINEAISPYFSKKHLSLRAEKCKPAIGARGNSIMIAFVCDGYNKTMLKRPDNEVSSDSTGIKMQMPVGSENRFFIVTRKEGNTVTYTLLAPPEIDQRKLLPGFPEELISISKNKKDEDHKVVKNNKDEDYKVVLGADEKLKLPGLPGELRVWIGSPQSNPKLPTRMATVDRIIPSIGKTAMVTPFAPTFDIDPKQSICMGIHPSGSETQFKLTPTKTGTFDIGANILLFNGTDCSGTPVPKSAETLKITVVVNSDEAFEERTKRLGEIFWEKLMEFWGLLLALFFALLLFLVRRRLKKSFSFGDDK